VRDRHEDGKAVWWRTDDVGGRFSTKCWPYLGDFGMSKTKNDYCVMVEHDGDGDAFRELPC